LLGPVHADAQVNAFSWLPGERLPSLSVQPAGDRGGQGPGEHRQPSSRRRPQGSAGGCLVVRMAGDAGVVEDEHPVRPVSAGQPDDVVCQYVRRDRAEVAAGVVPQRDGRCAELGACLPQFLCPFPVQVGAAFVHH